MLAMEVSTSWRCSEGVCFPLPSADIGATKHPNPSQPAWSSQKAWQQGHKLYTWPHCGGKNTALSYGYVSVPPSEACAKSPSQAHQLASSTQWQRRLHSILKNKSFCAQTAKTCRAKSHHIAAARPLCWTSSKSFSHLNDAKVEERMMKETSFSDSVAKNRNSLLVKKSQHDYESNVGDKL